MAARKSRRSRSVGIERQRRYGARPTKTRAPLPIVVVVCDDARTAVSYFTELKRRVKQSVTVDVVRNPHDRASAAEVVGCAVDKLKELKRDTSTEERKRDSVWVLIDLEGVDHPDRQAAAYAAKRDGERRGVKVVLSNPCYEMWTLLHLEDTGGFFQNCRAVLARVEQVWEQRFREPFGPKAQANYAKIIGDRNTAAARAEQHRENGDQSWTELYKVVNAIDELDAASAAEQRH